MSKILILFFFIIFQTYSLHAQNFDKQLLESIGQTIVRQNNYFLLKKKVGKVEIIADPVSGKKNIRYPDSPNKFTKLFKRYSETEQFAIMNSKLLPIFPLADTIFVVDSLKFFPEGLGVACNHHFFKVVEISNTQNKHEQLYLYAVGVRGNDFILSFSFYNSIILSNYYFNIDGMKSKVVKSSIFKMNNETE